MSRQKPTLPRDKLTGSETQRDAGQQERAWSRHEHVSPPVQTQAQRLLHEAGSPELAHLAVEQAADEATPPSVDLDQLAERWGFGSRHEMLAASVSIASRHIHAWWATPVHGGGWVAWCQRDGAMSERLQTLDACREFIAAVSGDTPS